MNLILFVLFWVSFVGAIYLGGWITLALGLPDSDWVALPLWLGLVLLLQWVGVRLVVHPLVAWQEKHRPLSDAEREFIEGRSEAFLAELRREARHEEQGDSCESGENSGT
jgi:hypothetical protein